jgi:hypothetical protein
VLYNILMEKHDQMMGHNLIVEKKGPKAAKNKI